MVNEERCQSAQSSWPGRRGSSNSHPGLIYETDKRSRRLIYDIPEVGSEWWWWNSALGLWEWLTVLSVNQVANGVVVLSGGLAPEVRGRLQTLREGWGYEPVTDRDRRAVPLRDLFPETRQESLLP